jgi:sulfur relay (sulfurtransferase) complex TusBCD TusD component (DsrE family)
VPYERAISISTDPHLPGAVKFFEKKKVYYCISCAKHRGIFEKKREMAARARRF